MVDTGSVDGTVALAEARGAKVSHFEWCDDFAAARNASLDEATGDFVLVLDADERVLDPAPWRAIMQAEPAEGRATVYLPLIQNVDAAGHSLGADHMVRLWRRRPELRFVGRVHERLEGIPRLRQVYDDRLCILHLGYDPALKQARGKGARNRRLLQAELLERPEDPQLWFYLAREHYAVGEDEAALPLFLRVIEEGSIVNFALSARLFAVECLRTLQRPAEAAPLLVEGYPELAYVVGRAALEAGDPEAALRGFEAAQASPEGVAAAAFRDPSVPQRALVDQAELLFALGRVAEVRALLPRVRSPELAAEILRALSGR